MRKQFAYLDTNDDYHSHPGAPEPFNGGLLYSMYSTDCHIPSLLAVCTVTTHDVCTVTAVGVCTVTTGGVCTVTTGGVCTVPIW